MSKNNIGDNGGSYLIYLLDTYGKNIEFLNLSYCKIGKQSLDLLTAMLSRNVVKLTSLKISGNYIGDKLFSELCLGISKNTYLSKFWSADNDLEKVSCVILGTVLRYDKKLQFLDLSSNKFDDDIISNLFKGLISNSKLETLILNNNNLTNKSLKILETTLQINNTLKALFLERNKLTNLSCEHISTIFNKNLFIETISIAANKIDTDGTDIILDRQRKIPIKIIDKMEFFRLKIAEHDMNMLYEYF